MPIDESCPCGAVIKAGYESVDYATQALIDIVIDTATKRAKFGQFLALVIGTALDNVSLCSLPRPAKPREFTLSDFVVWFPVGQALAMEWLFYLAYAEVCQCVECPPVTDCGDGMCFQVDWENGYPRPGFEEFQKQYNYPTGTEIWVARADGVCLGAKNGVLITWTTDSDFDPDLHVEVCEGNGTGCTTYSSNVIGHWLQLCIGEGDGPPPRPPWPDAPDGVADWYGPPVCSTSDICTALEYVYTTTRQIQSLVQVIAGDTWGLTAPVEVTLPGMNGPITGTLATALTRLIEALAPVQPSQLVSGASTPVTTTTAVDLSNKAYCRVDVHGVPNSMGSRGYGEPEIYYSNARSPGPGWAVVYGQQGVLRHFDLVYPAGVEFPVESTATDLALWLSPGVTVTVTTWEREV